MPKVLDMEMLSNAEVLSFIREKKLEHKQQEAEDLKQYRKVLPKPANYIRALDQHQEHLESDHYPYEKNPSVYGNAGMIKTLAGNYSSVAQTSDMAAGRKFNQLFAEQIVYPTVKERMAATKLRLGRDLMPAETEAIINDADNERALSETERLMLLNHAPTCLETLQPMIESVETRYTDEEQALIVLAIQQAFRPDEQRAAADNVGSNAMDVDE